MSEKTEDLWQEITDNPNNCNAYLQLYNYYLTENNIRAARSFYFVIKQRFHEVDLPVPPDDPTDDIDPFIEFDK